MLKNLNFLKKIFGSTNQRKISALNSTVEQINKLEESFAALSDTELKNKTNEFKKRLQNKDTLDIILPEAFAAVREASKRVIGQRHFDVQLMGGIILHQGKISEMKTGEGKTLVATLPVYLNSLQEKGVHVVTVNDYLAKRDSEWMGQIYQFLGLSVGCLTANVQDEDRKKIYNCDVVYGTNNEFAFDYLRDNMKLSLDEMVQRDFHYCIVDEVDSILIDEARTPLIISGPSETDSSNYFICNKLVQELKVTDYQVDEKDKNINLTDSGIDSVESKLSKMKLLQGSNFYDPSNLSLVHHINQSLKANILFIKDKDYILRDNQVQIIDEFTGRVLEGRRYGDGLHQAIEAKEGVPIQSENQTFASTTYQNYFRLYKKLAGMTGTAITEAEEFYDIYRLDVVEVPTNVVMSRKDLNDQIFRTEKEKLNAIVQDIKEARNNKQPVLVGTTSIEKSEKISNILKQEGIKHSVLNAKQHEKEAEIIQLAGCPESVTIATNMAGRGTDIKLGPGVEELGGLHIIGTARHESRRIDLQLRGRSGRQGDSGSSKFYISLEDDLMRLFNMDKLASYMDRLAMDEDQELSAGMLNRGVSNAQKKVEERNFGMRKHLLEYDDVLNQQREIIYELRNKALLSESIKSSIDEFIDDFIYDLFEPLEMKSKKDWDWAALNQELNAHLLIDVDASDFKDQNSKEEIVNTILSKALQYYNKKEEIIPEELLRKLEKFVVLRTIDEKWRNHLLGMDQLREGIGLRAFGQKNPLIEYKAEAYNFFQDLMASLRASIVQRVYHAQISENTRPTESASLQKNLQLTHADASVDAKAQPVSTPENNMEEKIGRNDKIKVLSPSGEAVEIKFKKLESYLLKGYTRG